MPSADDMRVASLRALDVLDSEPEPVFDAIAKLASSICGTPISLISLVDAQRQWFKARTGLEGVTETERAVAFCSHTIEQDEMLLVHDALHDQRFATNPLVTGAPGIRFYAGVPLALRDGSRCGTLCVIDHQPRSLSPHQVELLTELAKVAAWALEARRALGREAQNTQTLDAGHTEASALLDLDGRIRSWNAAAEYLLELPAAEVLGRSASDFVRPEHAVELNDAIAEVRAAGHGRHCVTTRAHPSGRTLRLLERLTPIRDVSGQVMAIRQVLLKVCEPARAECTAPAGRLGRPRALSSQAWWPKSLR
jgi:PAS domain S-box-containing protein